MRATGNRLNLSVWPYVRIMAKALVDALPFPIRELTWQKLPDVVAAAGLDFSQACDLLKIVIGDPPTDIEAKRKWFGVNICEYNICDYLCLVLCVLVCLMVCAT